MSFPYDDAWRRGRDSNPLRHPASGRFDGEMVGWRMPESSDKAADWAAASNDRGHPDLGKTPEQVALEREIAELAAQGREEEREAAAWRLADMIMRRTLP
jgi:hypothetical protein